MHERAGASQAAQAVFRRFSVFAQLRRCVIGARSVLVDFLPDRHPAQVPAVQAFAQDRGVG